MEDKITTTNYEKRRKNFPCVALCHTGKTIYRKKNGNHTIIKEVKKFHQQELIIIKIGNFYHCYGKDAYIISYLLGYKLSKTKENYYVCGFPIKSIVKVENMLERKKVNYIILDRKNNYDIEVFKDYKNLNQYQSTYEKAKKYIKTKNNIEEIYEKLIKNINEKDINQKINNIKNILKDNK